MKTFKREGETLLAQLMGNPWSTHARVGDVIAEYSHLVLAAKTPTQVRRVSLQIFHACRAIDTLLAHIVEHESMKPGAAAKPSPLTLGSSLRYIRTKSIGGARFTVPVNTDLVALTKVRNGYLHSANTFPGDGEIHLFLTRSILAIQEATTFPT